MLRDLHGVGTDVASQLLITAVDNPERIRNQATGVNGNKLSCLERGKTRYGDLYKTYKTYKTRPRTNTNRANHRRLIQWTPIGTSFLVQ